MSKSFIIKFFLFLIFLIIIGFFLISIDKSKVVIENTSGRENINADLKNENNKPDLVAENVVNQNEDEDVKDIGNAENNNNILNTKEIKKESAKKSKPEIKIIQNLVSWGYENSSERYIDTIIIHSSYDALGNDPYDLDGLLKEYKLYKVAPHYVIGRKGEVYKLVADKNIAYHAGVSQMPDGRNNVNDFSIGIELMNTENDKYTEDQYKALLELIDYLKNEHKIEYILGHSQITPGRKTDPWNFDYSRME